MSPAGQPPPEGGFLADKPMKNLAKVIQLILLINIIDYVNRTDHDRSEARQYPATAKRA